MKRVVFGAGLCLAGVLALGVWCSHKSVPSHAVKRDAAVPAKSADAGRPGAPEPCSLVLVPHKGAGKVDREIIRLQTEVANAADPARPLERLGWMFVAKARASFDPGFYKLAEQCALCLDARQPQSLEAMLLRGHVLHNLHRFKEAEPLARELVLRRGLAVDFGLLGDVLMEQGRLTEAIEAYQRMMSLRPDMHAYARGAHARWLKGDLAGAVELMEMAARASSPQDREGAAWVHTRLASLQFQAGEREEATRVCAEALLLQKDYPPALLLRGRLLLADGNSDEAVEALQRATELNPLPEYQWALAEALRDAGRAEEAAAVEVRLAKSGAATDPRTYALYLATRGESVEAALRLTERELEERSDVFTHDARAWALAAAGEFTAAQGQLDHALAEGTQDARLFYHAAVIAAKSGRHDDARRWFDRATDFIHMLLPSEQRQLVAIAEDLGDEAADVALAPEGAPSKPTPRN